MTSASAYKYLEVDPTTTDEDVVVACYPRRNSSEWDGPILGAWKAIADARQSRFLLFVLSIHPHLNDRNVAILAKKDPVVSSEPEPEPESESILGDMESSPLEESSSSEGEVERDV